MRPAPTPRGAYHLSTLAYLHWDAIGGIVASDVDAVVLGTARRNLGLLTLAELDQRAAELAAMRAAYGKVSHAAALASAARLRERLMGLLATHTIPVQVFQADATDAQSVAAGLAGSQVDLVFADVPYGWHSAWQDEGDAATSALSPLARMLGALQPVLSPESVVAIAADKGQRVAHAAYRRLERFQVGKRQVVLLRLASAQIR